MKLRLFLLSAFSVALMLSVQATVHNVTVSSNTFSPSSLTITQGDTVVWTNTGGSHNVNGSIATFSSNPAGFGPIPVGTGWVFQHTFTVAGNYSYQCDPHAPGMSGSITVNPVARDLVLTAMYDGPLTGGQPKGIEIYALSNITDLSTYGVGSANNGGGSDSVEFQFPAVSVTQGDYIYVSTDSTAFYSFFGFSADYISSSMLINGDDAVELFNNGIVIDVFGDINTDGTGTAWEYLDSWAYRKNNTGPDSNNFVLANWNFGGINVYDPVSTNAAAVPPMPIGTYSPFPPVVPTVNFASATRVESESAGTVTVNILLNPAPLTAQTVDLQFALGSGITLPGDGSVSPLPNPITGILQLNVPANEDTISFDVTITDDAVIEGNETLFVSVNAISAGLALGTTTNMIFVVEDNDFRTVDIASVKTLDADLRPDSIGLTFKMHGVVFTDDFDGNAGYSFYIYDNTGGINVFRSSDVNSYTVNRGDSVRVIGEIDFYNGLTELVLDSIKVLKTGVALKQPANVSVLDESTESEYIRMDYWKFVDATQWVGTGSSFNIDITNGVDTFEMRIDSDIDLANMPLPTSGLFSVIGVGNQFDGSAPHDENYQIFPRDSADIIPINEVSIDVASAIDANLEPVELENKLIISGVVYTDDFDDNNGHSFFIYDNTGGINVFNFNDVSGYTVTRGDSIRVYGEIDQFSGLTEIFADSIEVLKTGVGLKNPQLVSVLDETTEGEYIRMNNWSFVDATQWTTGSGSGGFNVDITNGTDTFVMRIDAATDLYNMPVPTATTFHVIGAGAQFTFNTNPADGGYQIFPRDSMDIITNISIDEVAALDVTLYPNPASDVVNIRRGDNKPAKVTLTTNAGAVVQRLESTESVIRINTSDLARGVYFISLEIEGVAATRKVIVQ